MPKYRQLHTKIIDSFDFNEMPNDFIRLVWVLLTLILDSEGRGIDNMDWVKSRMFPIRVDVTPDQLSTAFDWLEDRKMIVRYQVKGRRYFYIPTFKDYQSGTKKEAQSLLPPPDELLQTYSRPTPEAVVVAASASESESESALNMNLSGEVFRAYESEIGIITPAISDEILSMLEDVPMEYFIKAFGEAAKNNKRSWAYAKAILKRYKVEGVKQNGSHGRLEGKQSIQLPDGQIVEATL